MNWIDHHTGRKTLSASGRAAPSCTEHEHEHLEFFKRITGLFRFWDALPPAKSRADLDPLILGKSLLPHLCLGHFLEDGTDFRYDLIGSEIKKIAPRLVPGSRASETMEIQKTKHDHILTLFLEAGVHQEPRIHEVRYNSVEDVPLRIYAAFLPLGLDEDRFCAEDLLIAVWRARVDSYIAEDNSVELTEEFRAYAKRAK